MSYFNEVVEYQSYSHVEADFHFIYNSNSGGGQSFLGGQFLNESGNLSFPTVLDGRIGVFCIVTLENKHILLNDKKGRYEIKPRGEGSTSMKLGVGTKMESPNKLISAFFMLPPTCTIKTPRNLDVSILTTNNYWLQSMWLKCEQSDTSNNEVYLMPIDFIYCGGSSKEHNEKGRFFKLDASRRITDIIALSKKAESLPESIRQYVKFFADIYSGNTPFEYDKCSEATIHIMSSLTNSFPDKYSGIEDPLPLLMRMAFSSKCMYMQTTNIGSLQIIYYGAPGTGKSYEINKLTIGKDVVRTTFHPDSDYSTFVGAYKPTMEEVTKCVVPVVVNNGISLSPASQYKEKQITYKFVKQAFLKAYLAAWKKMCNPTIILPVTFKVGSSSYIIKSIDNNGITQIKEECISKNAVARIWNDASYWGTGEFQPTTGEQSGTSVQQAISKYMNDQFHTTKEQFEEGWNKVIEKLKENEIKASKATKPYILKDSGKDDEIIFTAEASNTRERLKKCYEHPEEANGVEKGITDILKGYNPSDFDDAWEKLKDAVNAQQPEPDPQFLVIEEINRGNCAQIFGDLFQLLDRSNNGFSSYPIEADSDLQQAIAEAFANEKEYQLSQDIYVEGAVPGYQSNYGANLSEDIQKGRILLLPPNLFIWATMNTSDQSLFPIDSAFKRRWDWKYTKISKGIDKKNNKPLNWTIDFDYTYKDNTKHYSKDWWEFIKVINEKIAAADSSDDKKLGYFFCKPTSGTSIDAETFVSKVVFYLWTDVFKDSDNELFRIEGEPSFDFFYKIDEEGHTVIDTNVLYQFMQNVFDGETVSSVGEQDYTSSEE